MDYEIKRAKLKVWLQLDEINFNLHELESRDKLADLIYLYLSIATGISIEEWEKEPWYVSIEAYTKIVQVNLISKKLPILSSTDDKAKAPWEYDGRTWYVWLHRLAKAYNWTTEYIAELDIDDALALLQEIIIDEQLQKEWEWGMSEIAYPYNQQTKKSEYKPLNRPSWMEEKKEPPKKTKIPISMLPIGNIIRYNNANESTTFTSSNKTV